MMKKIAIIVLNFNGKKDTIECLQSLRRLAVLSLHTITIVVDNASTDDSVTVIKSKFSDVVLIENKKNLGYAEGNNIGMQYATEQGVSYVLILNNDTTVDKNLLRELAGAIEEDNTVGIVVPKIYFAKGHEFHRNSYKKEELGKVIWYAGGKMDWNNIIGYHRGVDEVDRGQYDKIEETEFATGNCMLIKKEVLEKIGLLDKRFFLYYEDADYSMRIKNAGFKIIFAPGAKLWHKNAASAGGSGSNLQDYYITRNRLLFGMRYAPLRAKIALIRESFFLLINGRVWQRRGVLDFYIGRFGKGSYVIFDI